MNSIYLLPVLLLVTIVRIQSYYVGVDETKFHLVKSYLCRYGYMNEDVCKQHADDSLKFMQNNARDMYRGLLIFQTMFNITKTGKIDDQTIIQMSKPRCGNKDFDLQFSLMKFSTQKKVDLTSLRNSLKHLTYSIRKYNPYLNRYSRSMSDEEVEATTNKAFEIWLNALGDHVKITQLNENDEKFSKSNITIYFAEAYHGDSMLFDGIDGELAHSCPLSNMKSPFKGHIHLDDSENWDRDDRLLSVMLHHIGHLLGLDHSGNPRSIMSPLFNFNTDELLEEDVRNVKLVLGIEKLSETEKESALKNIVKTEPTNEPVLQVEEKVSLGEETLIRSKIEPVPVIEIAKPIEESIRTQEPIDETTPKMFSNDNLPIIDFVPEEKLENTTLALDTSPTESTKLEFAITNPSTNVENTTLASTTTQLLPTTTTKNYTIIELNTNISLAEPKVSNSSNDLIFGEKKSTTSIGTTSSVELKHQEDDEFLNLLLRMNLSTSDLTTQYIPPKTTLTPLLIEESILNETANAPVPKAINKTDELIVEEETLTISSTTSMTTTAKQILEKSIDLCEDPEIDEITRTEWGNAFIFKGDFVYHIRGLTKWRLFDYDGWPKRISELFPHLPGHIDAAYFYDDHYYFSKNDMLWRYRILNSYPPKYVLDHGYPKQLKDEYPELPFNSVDSAFAITTSIFFFKNTEFWQSNWSSNVTGKVPFRVNAAVSWRTLRPQDSTGPQEPLAYIINNSSMFRFNHWSSPLGEESLDIRYFLFDCVQTNYQPNKAVFIGPSYKQAFMANDIVYSNEALEQQQDEQSEKSGLKPYVARSIHEVNNNNTLVSSEEPKITQLSNGSFKINILLGTLFLILCFIMV